MNCNICDKTFTGAVCLQQHLNSEKHKKKAGICYSPFQQTNIPKTQPASISDESSVLGESDASISDESSVLDELDSNFICTACQRKFFNAVQYIKHLENYHVKQTFTSTKSDFLCNSASMASCNSNPFYCKICDTICTGPIPFEQHMKSEVHHKKCAASTVNNQTVKEFNPWYCEICEKNLNSCLQFEQHLKGTIHNKNMLKQNKHGVINAKNTEAIIPDLDQKQCDTKLLCCEVCDVICTGQVAFEQHMVGDGHRKNVTRKGILDKYSNSENMMVVDSEDSLIYPVNDTIEALAKNLNVTVFLINEEINFDKPIQD